MKLIKRLYQKFIYLVKGYQKFDYLIKLIVMSYYEVWSKEIGVYISALKKEDLQDISSLISELFEKYKKEEIKLNYTNDMSILKASYNNVPIGLKCNISSNGIVDEYTFRYKIEEGRDFLKELIEYIKIVNPNYEQLIKFYIDDDYIKYITLNYCNDPQSVILQNNLNVFNSLSAFISSTQIQLNYSNNFTSMVTNHVKNRLLKLNSSKS